MKMLLGGISKDMASGDIVSAIGIAGATLIFQPAVSVEVCLTFLADNVGVQNNSITNGVTDSTGWNYGASTYLKYGTIKLFVNNTNYLKMNGAGTTVFAYTGIQIK